jgi:hypothetical protein
MNIYLVEWYDGETYHRDHFVCVLRAADWLICRTPADHAATIQTLHVDPRPHKMMELGE